MEILINDTRTISEVQRDFSLTFPYLKIEFFSTPYEEGRALPKSKMFMPDRRLGTIRQMHTEGNLAVTGSNKVCELENNLWQNFGLSAQVFRKSGNLWIETSLTDSWTLERQNREGLEMSSTHKNPYKEAEEKDLADRDKWE